MDTKEKHRPASGQRRPASKKTAFGKRKPAAPARKTNTAARSNPGTRRPNPIREPEKAAAHQAARAQQAAAHREITTEAQEEVFRPENIQQRKPRDPAAAKRSAQRRKSAKRAQEREALAKRRKNRPPVVYTDPKPFNLNRLLIQLVAVLAIALAVTMGLSVFFKVDTVVVYGNKAYSAWAVQEAAGLEGGENLLSFGRTKACGKIKTNLPYVKSVRIGITLPDTVNIYIEEFDVSYAIQTIDETWWLITSGGKVVEQIDGGTAGKHTKILGVYLDAPEPGMPAKALETIQVSATEEVDVQLATETTAPPVVTTGAGQLIAALQILTAMERNDIVGEVASVNVESLTNIVLWYGARYQVNLGDTNEIEKKISYMNQAVAQLSEYQIGVLDVSFVTWPDQVGFTPAE